MGETSGGDPLFEVRSVRLVLRPDATHFNRVAACAKCGREAPGAAVLSPADLDLVPHPVICKSCVSTAGSPMFETERRRPLAPAPSPPAQSAVNGSAPGPRAAMPADDDRVEALERKLDEALKQLRVSREAPAGGGQDWDEMSRRVDHIAERLMQESAGRARFQDLEERVQRLQAMVEEGLVQPGTAALEQTKADLARVEATLSAKLERLAAGLDGVARLSDQVNERLDRLSERTVRTEPVDHERLHVVERQVDEAVRRLAEVTESQKADLHDGLAEVRSEIDEVAAADAERLQALEEWTVLATDADTQRLGAIEQHLEEASERLAQALESQRA